MLGYMSRLPLLNSFNGAASNGPRRILMLAGGVVLIGAAIFGVASIQRTEPAVSNPGRLPSVNPLPGGVHSNPQQDKLALIANQDQADVAQKAGRSYTPVMASSQPYVEPQITPTPTVPAPPTPNVHAKSPTAPAPVTEAATSVAPPFAAPAPYLALPPAPRLMTVSSPGTTVTPAAQGPSRTPQEEASFKAALDKMMAGWGGRAPRTDVVLPPDDPAAAENAPQPASATSRRRFSGNDERSADPPVSASTAVPQRVLVPAGRGVYAHTILAANSDAQSPVVLQADSGPISGDRMIGTFSRERDRLVIRISKVIHNGQELGANGVVVAPGSMEVGVASSVDQNYLSRFALPAAAAFVQGLGQAIAQSNSTSVIGPLGSVGVQNRLNFDQQLGIGAGVAAAQIGSALQQSAPHGPTVILDVNSSVGVMFLTNVTANP